MMIETLFLSALTGVENVIRCECDDELEQQQNLKQPFHTGKWSSEEEAFVKGLIEEFIDGYMDLCDGTSLRQFLAKMLHCRAKVRKQII